MERLIPTDLRPKLQWLRWVAPIVWLVWFYLVVGLHMNRSRDYHEVRAAVFYELASAGNPPLNSMGSSAKDQFKVAETMFGPVKSFQVLYAFCALGGTPAIVKVKVNRTKGSYEETLSFYGKENPDHFHNPALLKLKP